MNPFTINQIADITGGKFFPGDDSSSEIISQVVTDSRIFFKRDEAVFFAIVGARNNGHNYIPELFKKGVKNFVVSESNKINSGSNFILVNDTTTALQKLAGFYRNQFQYPVIGITGSNGKTIIKEWLHDLMAEEFKIIRSPKSYNSQIGVPLSVLLMNEKYNLGIFEAGISQLDEMQNLAEIVHPDVGIFTNIGDAHQENFKSYGQKIDEKLKLFRHSKKLVYCVDTEILSDRIHRFCDENSIKKVSWSLKKNDSQISFTSEKGSDFTKIEAVADGKRYDFEIPFTDDSAIENACHCFAVVWVISGNLDLIIPRFKKIEPVAMRLEIKQGINNCLLINDYYNSDLNSLSIALSVLHQQAAKVHLHKILILSDIQQTDVSKSELYQKVNELLTEWKIDEIIGIGSEIAEYSSLFTMNKKIFPDLQYFEKSFHKEDFNEAVILIKGARKFTFERISDLLQQKTHQTVLEINMNALVYNLNVFRSLLNDGTKIMVMVKAFSYGTGDVEIAKLLQYQNVDYLAVAVADEGVQLRNAGIHIPIIVMSPEEHSLQTLVDYQLDPNIYSIEILERIIKTVSRNALEAFPVHLKIDTGMNRLGFKNRNEIREVIHQIKISKCLKVKSVFSHLAASDDPGFDEFTIRQIENFEKIFGEISQSFDYKIDRHILNSV